MTTSWRSRATYFRTMDARVCVIRLWNCVVTVTISLIVINWTIFHPQWNIANNNLIDFNYKITIKILLSLFNFIPLKYPRILSHHKYQCTKIRFLNSRDFYTIIIFRSLLLYLRFLLLFTSQPLFVNIIFISFYIGQTSLDRLSSMRRRGGKRHRPR